MEPARPSWAVFATAAAGTLAAIGTIIAAVQFGSHTATSSTHVAPDLEPTTGALQVCERGERVELHAPEGFDPRGPRKAEVALAERGCRTESAKSVPQRIAPQLVEARYFHTEDKAAAMRIATAAGAATGLPSKPHPLTTMGESVPPGTIELWFPVTP